LAPVKFQLAPASTLTVLKPVKLDEPRPVKLPGRGACAEFHGVGTGAAIDRADEGGAGQ